MGWSEADIPDLSGKTALVTGANSGLGLRTAQALSRRGAHVVMACRSAERGRRALATIDGPAELLELDLADLTSVRKAAAEVRERTGDRLDILINNAGVMAVPPGRTVDGFELQFGTNHLGHAALTWLLVPALREVAGARVVTVSSLAHRGGGLDLDDLNFERRPYRSITAYSQSKLANLLFAFELHRRVEAAGLDLVSVAAHPGLSATELAANTTRNRVRGPLSRALTSVVSVGNRLVMQSAARGALPQLYTATAPDVRGGEYYGPSGPGQVFGGPTRVSPRPNALNPDHGRTLWVRTADLTGVSPDPA
ncbi:oxidoreductase [Actinokineospora auranticolor]|uniref:Protochlorophyllide reductase n=1 Tax=Actinokineospora auranticolor TaxID=155976 RepID=A0A2S6GVC5_9PSEU|nr:oxidoreductase [Actinokineospora auranticolor]PPK69202.1 protochlorophyllide reductase [Actinokineospora auranticolor]